LTPVARSVSPAGLGSVSYELEEGWGRVPETITLGQVAVATDSRDNVYLFNRGDHSMVVLDRVGTYLTSWGDPRLNSAHGIFIDAADNVYLPVRDASVVLKYGPDWVLLMTLGTWDEPSDTGYSGDFRELPLRAAGPFNRPTDVAVSPSGDIYVSDGYGNARVHRFTPHGVLVNSWGEPGKVAPGEFHVPHAVWVHTDGRVLVADRENNRIQVFTPDGDFLDQWSNLYRPSDIFVDEDGIAYVAELDSLVAILSLSGELIARWGSPTDSGSMRGGHSIWVDSRGDIYVGQNVDRNRLLKYRRY
jgi:DNA-binding beta-propeller fold protein YncE